MTSAELIAQAVAAGEEAPEPADWATALEVVRLAHPDLHPRQVRRKAYHRWPELLASASQAEQRQVIRPGAPIHAV